MIVSVETTHEASKMKKLYGGQSKETNKPAVQDSLKAQWQSTRKASHSPVREWWAGDARREIMAKAIDSLPTHHFPHSSSPMEPFVLYEAEHLQRRGVFL